jgi:hypothetical protein
VGAPGGGDLTQPLGAGREEGAETIAVEAFKAPEPAQAAPEVLETKSLAALPDLPKPANPDKPDVVEPETVAAEEHPSKLRNLPRKLAKKPKADQPPGPVKPPAAKEIVTKRGAAARKTAAGEAKASARSEGKSKAKPAAGKTAEKTATTTAAKKSVAGKTKGGR